MSKIKNIIHLADVHIMKNKHHDYSKQVAERFFKSLRDNLHKYKEEETIVVIVGDIVDNKISTSNEMYDIVSKFFQELSSIYKTYVVIGNHDYNDKNRTRKDSLSPIIGAISSDRLVFIKHSSEVIDRNVRFVSYSCFDDFKIPQFGIDEKLNVGLFHDILPNSEGFPNKLLRSEKNHSLEMFEGCDVVMLGDVHKRQELIFTDSKGRDIKCVYPSSLRQVKADESIEKHGYLVWNVDSLEYEEVDIDHDYGIYKFNITSVDSFTQNNFTVLNSVNPDNTNIVLNKNAEARIFYNIVKSDLDETMKSDVKADFYKRFPDFDIKKQKIDVFSTNIKSINLNSDEVDIASGIIEDIADDKVQRELVDKYCELNDVKLNEHEYKRIDAEVGLAMVDIVDVDNRFNVYKFLEIDVENFQCFEKIKITYSDYNGLCAVVSNPMNEAGKTTLSRIRSFLLYKKANNFNEKVIELFNDSNDARHMSFVGKLELNEKIYVIDRMFTRTKSDKVTHILKFTEYDKEGNELKVLTSTTPQETQKVINRYFGNFDDFYNTQRINIDNLKTVINSSSSEKNTVLSAHLGLDILTQKGKVCKNLHDTWKKTALIKKHDIGIIKNVIEENKSDLTNFKKRKAELSKSSNKLNIEKEDYETKIKAKKNKLEKVEYYNIESLEATIVQKNTKLSSIATEGKDLKVRLGHITNPNTNIAQSNIKITEIDSAINKLRTELGSHITVIKDFERKLEASKEVITCERCDKVFKETQKNIDILERGLLQEKAKKELTNKDIESKQKEVKQLKLGIELQEKYTERVKEINTDIEAKRTSYMMIQEQIEEANNKISKYHEQEEMMLHNKLIQSDITKLEDELRVIIGQIAKVEGEVSFIVEKEQSITKNISEKEQLYALMVQEVGVDRMYTLYHKMMGRNGIAKLIINNAVQGINNSLEEFLHDTVNFRVTLEQTDKNDYEFYFHETLNNREVKRRLALCSGWQLLAPSLAINFVLSMMSALPKSSCIDLDEILNAASSDNYENVKNIIIQGSEYYDTVFLISHNPEIQDWCESTLHVEKNPQTGISRIIN